MIFFEISGRIPHTRGDEPWTRSAPERSPLSIPHTRGDEPSVRVDPFFGVPSIPHTRGDEPDVKTGSILRAKGDADLSPGFASRQQPDLLTGTYQPRFRR